MPSPLSECALRSLGLFGLTTDDARRESHDRAAFTAARAADLDRTLRPGQLALITGPSAAGKSSILRALATLPHTVAASASSAAAVPSLTASNALAPTVIDALAPTPADLPAALRALSASGLADAFIPSRPITALSEGERARLSLARAILHAESLLSAGHAPTILLDDFADALDDATSISVAHTLRRWLARHPAARIIVATVRPHIAGPLRPDVIIDLHRAPVPDFPATRIAPFTISHGTPTDFHALAPFHYRAGRPATIASILAARDERSPDPLAVLVVSMPTLNGAWRPLAWPDRFPPAASKRIHATQINRDLRCISRLIVHPLHRARGLGSALLRHYLADPLTPHTEAVSAMGACSPVFARAGMREWMLPPAARDLRLVDALSAADLRPWMLADIGLVMDHLARFPHLDRVLRVWANAYGSTRSLASAPARDLVRAAAKHIITPRRAYTTG